jgi:hypothetical protein
MAATLLVVVKMAPQMAFVVLGGASSMLGRSIGQM